MTVPEPTVDDRVLLQAVRAGDKQAFDLFYRRHSPGLHAYLLAMSRDHELAEELLQQLWVRVLRSIAAVDGSRNWKAYVCRMARNLALDARERAGPVPESCAALLDLPAPSGGDEVARRESCHAMSRALLDLPRELRECVVLHVVDDMTFDDIAETLDVPRSTVRYRYESGLRALREKLHAAS